MNWSAGTPFGRLLMKSYYNFFQASEPLPLLKYWQPRLKLAQVKPQNLELFFFFALMVLRGERNIKKQIKCKEFKDAKGASAEEARG